jgi:hypothetical protein
VLPRFHRHDLSRAVQHFWKKPKFRRLLAVIEQGSVEEFELWRAEQDLDRIDPQSMKLLPLALAALERAGYRDRQHRRLMGMVRFMWVKSEAARNGARAASETLLKQGIQPTAIKGLALATSYGVNLAERPMLDADLVVEAERYVEAVKLLTSSGWVKITEEPKAATLRRDNHDGTTSPVELDLHRLALPSDPRFVLHRWNQAADGEPFHVLNRPGMVIVSGLHGIRHDGGALFHYDLKRLLDQPAPTQNWFWGRLEAYASDRRFGLALETALRPVCHPSLIVGLARMKTSVVEALELRHFATDDRHAREAARVMTELRGRGAGTITDQDIEGMASRVYFDRRWITEWQQR